MTALDHKPRRPRRIAADEAHAWARNLRLGNPYAKLVLCMLTLYVNGDGHCFVSVTQLAEDCEFALETVRRRLAWLETVGAIARLPQWIDEHGRRNGEGRGRRTSDEIRLLIDADPDEIEARAGGSDPPLPEGGQPDPEQADNSLAPHADPLAAPSLRTGAESFEPEPEEEVTPLPPKGGDPQPSIDQESEAKESPKVASWQRFERAWQEPILRQSIARQVWSALTESEEEIAIRAAKGYVVHRRSQKKPPNVINAHTFLRERDAWAGFALLAPAEPPKPKPVTVLPVDSDEFAALALSFAIARRGPLRPVDGGAKFSGDVPAGAAGLAALALFNPETFEVDQSDWTLAAQGSRRYVAWSERIKEWLGSWPEAHRYWLDRDGNIVPTVEQAEGYGDRTRLPKACDGLLLPPLEFPPPKGTGHSTTGPPLSQADADALANE